MCDRVADLGANGARSMDLELKKIDWSGNFRMPGLDISTSLRAGTARSLRAYLERGKTPIGFLRHVLSCDLKSLNVESDLGNFLELPVLVAWLKLYAPVAAWGSVGAVIDWRGIEAEQKAAAKGES